MVSVAQLTEKFVSLNPEIETCLRQGLINYSSLARQITTTYGLPSVDAAFAASRRLAERLGEAPTASSAHTPRPLPHISQKSVRSHFFGSTTRNSVLPYLKEFETLPGVRIVPTLSVEQPLIILEPATTENMVSSRLIGIECDTLELTHCLLSYPELASPDQLNKLAQTIIASCVELAIKPRVFLFNQSTIELLLSPAEFSVLMEQLQQ